MRGQLSGQARGVASRGHLARERSAAAGGAVLVAASGTGALLNYTFGLGLAWLLVPAEFGAVGAIQNVLMLAVGVLVAGPPWALTRRIARTRADAEGAGPEFRTALAANCGLGLLLAAAFLAAQLSGMLLVPTRSLPLDLTVAAEILLVAVNSILVAAALGGRRFAGAGTMQGGEILVKCVVAVALVKALHAGPEGVALGFLAGTLLSILMGVRTTRGLFPGPGPLATSAFLTASAAFWLASASMTFITTADLLSLEVIGAAAGVTAVTLAGYQACGALARASFYLSAAVGEAMFPFIARSETAGEQHRWFMAAARWVPLLIIPLQAGLALAPGPVLRLLLPHHYATVQPLLRVLAVGTLGALTTNMLMLALLAIGYGRQVGWRMCVMAAAEVAGLIALVPGHGGLGAAYAYLIAGYLGVALLAPLYLRVVHVRLPAPLKVAAYAAGLAPTAAMFAVADQSPPAAAWPLIVAAPCLFLLPARMMRLITDADITALRVLYARLEFIWKARGILSANAGKQTGRRTPAD